MSYTRIPELPAGGKENGYSVDVNNDLLVLEQDITRRITPLSFLSNSIAQLNQTSSIVGSNLIPLSDLGAQNTANLTIDNLMDYINHHLNVLHQVFYVNNFDGLDIDDVDERGKNIQLPYKTIKYAAKKVSDAIASDGAPPSGATTDGVTYDQNDPNFVYDHTPASPQQVANRNRKQYSIFVISGDYTEENPVYIPPNTTLIGDSLRRTTIRPANPQLDILWINNACYVWGFTFRDHKKPSAATAFPISLPVYRDKVPLEYEGIDQYTPTPGKTWVEDSYEKAYKTPGYEINLVVIPTKRPYIYVSPYVQGCTSYAISDRMPNKIVGDSTNNPNYPSTWFDVDDQNIGISPTNVAPPNNAGMGMRIDGSLVTGFIRSMVIDSFTQVNQGGWGIHLLNNGYAQFVSTFTVATECGIVCESGGTCSISTSNSTFGLSGLVARGRSFSPVLEGRFVIPILEKDLGDGKTHAYFKPSSATAAGNTEGVYGYTVGGNLFTINNTKALDVYYKGDGENVGYLADTASGDSGFMKVASSPYATLCFTVGDDKPWDTGNGYMSGPGYILEEEINPLISRTYASIDPTSPLSSTPIHEVKLFYIEQGAPTPTFSNFGKTNSYFDNNYQKYREYGLSVPEDPTKKPTNGLPWDIVLSYNLPLDLTNVISLSAFNSDGLTLHYYIDYKGRPQPITYKNKDNAIITSQAQYYTTLNTDAAKGAPNNAIDFTNAPVKFYARSVAETGSHTFEYMGTGTRIKYAIPAFGGVTKNENEAISDGILDPYGNRPGTVFFTSSNELGNFKVGTDFTIVQSTGTIQGETFNRAILTLVTPLTIILE
jgi:hypothetical protein